MEKEKVVKTIDIEPTNMEGLHLILRTLNININNEKNKLIIQELERMALTCDTLRKLQKENKVFIQLPNGEGHSFEITEKEEVNKLLQNYKDE